MLRKVTIGTRGSQLALWQANYIKERLMREQGLETQLQIVKTKGDKILDTPLAKIGGKGLFTKELDEMLLNGEIDLAVHSLKDVPVELPQNIELCAITKRADNRDCFVSVKYDSLDSLPKGAKIGTTSLRRTMQLKGYRADFDTQSLRGNVQSRFEKLKNGDFDAIILAKAALDRLEISESSNFNVRVLDFMVSAMGQGALGITCLADSEMKIFFQTLNAIETNICTTAERAFIKRLDGGCQVPIGVYAYFDECKMYINGILGLPDGSEILKSSSTAILDSNPHLALLNACELGERLADKFIRKGAKELLQRAYEMI